MNKYLSDTLFELGKADSLLDAIEGMYMDMEIAPEDMEKANRRDYMFYILKDTVKKATELLDSYTAECRIVNVLETVEKRKTV